MSLQRWSTNDVKHLGEVIRGLIAHHPCDAIGLAIGGPVLGRSASLTNLPWSVDADELQAAFQVPVILVNDMVAHGFGCVASQHKILLNGSPATGHATIIAPGTGLGEALMVRDGERWIAVPSEGSHASFAPNSPQQLELLRFAMKQHPHVSAERLISGSLGFPIITAFMLENSRSPADRNILTFCLQQESVGAAIHNKALEGHACAEAVIELFMEMLASEAANCALKSLSSGGIYLCGAIPRKLRAWIERPSFVKALTHKGRFSELLNRWPLYLVLDELNALQGLRTMLCQH